MVTAEEHSIIGGLGSAVAETIVEVPRTYGKSRVRDVFGESGEPEELLRKYGLSQRVVGAVKNYPKEVTI